MRLAALRPRCLLSAVCHAQRPHDRVGASWRAARSNSNFSACTAWAKRFTSEVVGDDEVQPAMPHLRARRRPRGSARLSGAPPARERRQHLVRQPARPTTKCRFRRSSPIRSRSPSASAWPANACRSLPRPRDIFMPERKNSAGLALVEASVRRDAAQGEIAKVLKTPFAVGPDRRRQRDDRRRCRVARRCPARPARAHRHGARSRRRRSSKTRLAAPRTRRGAGSKRRPRSAHAFSTSPPICSSATARADGGDRARSRQDARSGAGRRARSRRLSCATTRPRRGGCSPAPSGCRARRAREHADAARTRTVRLHIAVEFSARDLHRPGRRGARRRQSGDRQAGRADADHGLPRGQAAARSRRAARRAAPVTGGGKLGEALVKDPRIQASRSPAPTRRRGRSSGRSRTGAAPSCRSSPRPAASTP